MASTCVCAQCGARLRLLALIEAPSVIRRNRLSNSVCSDRDYLAMRFRRYAIAEPDNPNAGAALKKLCSRN